MEYNLSSISTFFILVLLVSFPSLGSNLDRDSAIKPKLVLRLGTGLSIGNYNDEGFPIDYSTDHSGVFASISVNPNEYFGFGVERGRMYAGNGDYGDQESFFIEIHLKNPYSFDYNDETLSDPQSVQIGHGTIHGENGDVDIDVTYVGYMGLLSDLTLRLPSNFFLGPRFSYLDVESGGPADTDNQLNLEVRIGLQISNGDRSR